jgi:hypothetical protein
MKQRIFCPLLLFALACPIVSFSQNGNTRDSIVYKIIYRDTVIYRYDTVRVKHYVHSDTLWTTPTVAVAENPATGQAGKRGVINRNSWGIGPSVGAYYSPFNGFDVNIGFGVQYYLFAIPSFRNPHTGHKRNGR